MFTPTLTPLELLRVPKEDRSGAMKEQNPGRGFVQNLGPCLLRLEEILHHEVHYSGDLKWCKISRIQRRGQL